MASMGCGGFACAKNALCVLNLLYMVVGLLLICVAAYAKGIGVVSSIQIIGGVIAVGSFLFLISILGLVAAVRHHQVLLFFYMLILFVLFLVQLSVSCACLALDRIHQINLLHIGWNNASPATRNDIQTHFHCCGFNDTAQATNCTKGSSPCLDVLQSFSEQVLQVAGGVGLFFSFTEIVTVWLTWRFRNMKDPQADPNAFL
ncbi:tetraspanin-31-like [Petromyzon marinus]|uniref:Tetraspanin-31-like n=1 Tax=Petromyzon marinus TaxID=7757 RepID=A0AAJ7SZD2_PETMA|nr:tetraspanin-31-like [Petromyzon marinus]